MKRKFFIAAWIFTFFVCSGLPTAGAYSSEALQQAAATGDWDGIAASLEAEKKSGDYPALLLCAAETALEAGQMSRSYGWLRELLPLLRKSDPDGDAALRARALQEYIVRHSADQVEVTLQLAEDLGEEKEPEALLDGAGLLLGRVRNWQEHNQPEWTQLAESLAGILDRFRDVGDPGLVARHTLLLVEVSNLRTGDFSVGAEKLQSVLQYYYPDALRIVNYRRELPYDACRLLDRLSAQYAGMAERANSAADKKRFYAQAAGYLLSTAMAQPEDSPEFRRASDRLLEYREALRLLGFQLKLPDAIVPGTDTGIRMFESMLDQHRYRAAESAVRQELDRDPASDRAAELRVLLVEALVGADKVTEVGAAVAALRAEELSDDGVTRLFQCARRLQEAQAATEALALFTVIVDSGRTAHPDYSGALYQAAQLALDCRKPGLAAHFFRRYGERAADAKLRARALLNAALCFYRNQDYERVREVSADASQLDDPEIRFRLSLLGAQAALQADLADLALTELSALRDGTEPIPEGLEPQLLLLTGIAAERKPDPELAARTFADFIESCPEEPAVLDCVGKMFELRPDSLSEAQLQRWADLIASGHLTRPAAAATLERIARFRLEHFSPESALDTYREVGKATRLPPEELLGMLQFWQAEAFDERAAARAQLAWTVFSIDKPKLNDDPAVRELYFRMLEILAAGGDAEHALALADELLACPEQYRFFEVKLLRASALLKTGAWEAAQADCRAVTAAGAPPEFCRRANLTIAEALAGAGQSGPAVAAAWRAVPPRFDGLSAADRETVERALRLITTCARQVAGEEDVQEAETMLHKLEALP